MNEPTTKYEELFYTKCDDHPHIIRTFGFVENNHGLTMLLQERAPLGNLRDLLARNQLKRSVTVLMRIFSQIVDAMAHVVKQNTVHGDLRCFNILVFEINSSEPRRNVVKLANFGLARSNDPLIVDDIRLALPVRYCAPEILRSAGRSNYSEASDIYSFGVLMWEGYSKGKLPYESSITNNEVLQRKLKGEELPKPSMCNDPMWSVIKHCWFSQPEPRFSFEDTIFKN